LFSFTYTSLTSSWYSLNLDFRKVKDYLKNVFLKNNCKPNLNVFKLCVFLNKNWVVCLCNCSSYKYSKNRLFQKEKYMLFMRYHVDVNGWDRNTILLSLFTFSAFDKRSHEYVVVNIKLGLLLNYLAIRPSLFLGK